MFVLKRRKPKRLVGARVFLIADAYQGPVEQGGNRCKHFLTREIVPVQILFVACPDFRHDPTELRHAAEGWVAATSENLALHVDMEKRTVAPFPDDILSNLAVMKAAHSRLTRPANLGRVIGVPERSGTRETLLAAGA